MRIAHVVLAAALVGGCGTSEMDKKPAAVVKDAPAGAKAEPPRADTAGPELDAAASSIDFVGSKLSLDHEGKFPKFTAALTLEGDEPTRLQLAVEPGAVVVEPEKLRKHLVGNDFFAAATHPTAVFSSTAITKAAAPATHTIEGLLELRGVTKSISFPATIAIDATSAKGKAEFTFNRKAFDIVYDGMADDLIKDDVLLKVDLTFVR